MIVMPMIVTFLFAFAGVVIPPRSLPGFWEVIIINPPLLASFLTLYSSLGLILWTLSDTSWRESLARHYLLSLLFVHPTISFVLMLLLIKLAKSIFKTHHPFLKLDLIFNSYAQTFLNEANAGYINNPTSINTECEYCPYRNGNDYLQTYDWDVSNRWRNFGIMFAYLIFNLALCVLFVHYWRKQIR